MSFVQRASSHHASTSTTAAPSCAASPPSSAVATTRAGRASETKRRLRKAPALSAIALTSSSATAIPMVQPAEPAAAAAAPSVASSARSSRISQATARPASPVPSTKASTPSSRPRPQCKAPSVPVRSPSSSSSSSSLAQRNGGATCPTSISAPPSWPQRAVPSLQQQHQRPAPAALDTRRTAPPVAPPHSHPEATETSPAVTPATAPRTCFPQPTKLPSPSTRSNGEHKAAVHRTAASSPSLSTPRTGASPRVTGEYEKRSAIGTEHDDVVPDARTISSSIAGEKDKTNTSHRVGGNEKEQSNTSHNLSTEGAAAMTAPAVNVGASRGSSTSSAASSPVLQQTIPAQQSAPPADGREKPHHLKSGMYTNKTNETAVLAPVTTVVVEETERQQLSHAATSPNASARLSRSSGGVAASLSQRLQEDTQTQEPLEKPWLTTAPGRSILKRGHVPRTRITSTPLASAAVSPSSRSSAAHADPLAATLTNKTVPAMLSPPPSPSNAATATADTARHVRFDEANIEYLDASASHMVYDDSQLGMQLDNMEWDRVLDFSASSSSTTTAATAPLPQPLMHAHGGTAVSMGKAKAGTWGADSEWFNAEFGEQLEPRKAGLQASALAYVHASLPSPHSEVSPRLSTTSPSPSSSYGVPLAGSGADTSPRLSHIAPVLSAPANGTATAASTCATLPMPRSVRSPASTVDDSCAAFGATMSSTCATSHALPSTISTASPTHVSPDGTVAKVPTGEIPTEKEQSEEEDLRSASPVLAYDREELSRTVPPKASYAAMLSPSVASARSSPVLSMERPQSASATREIATTRLSATVPSLSAAALQGETHTRRHHRRRSKHSRPSHGGRVRLTSPDVSIQAVDSSGVTMEDLQDDREDETACNGFHATAAATTASSARGQNVDSDLSMTVRDEGAAAESLSSTSDFMALSASERRLLRAVMHVDQLGRRTRSNSSAAMSPDVGEATQQTRSATRGSVDKRGSFTPGFGEGSLSILRDSLRALGDPRKEALSSGIRNFLDASSRRRAVSAAVDKRAPSPAAAVPSLSSTAHPSRRRSVTPASSPSASRSMESTIGASFARGTYSNLDLSASARRRALGTAPSNPPALSPGKGGYRHSLSATYDGSRMPPTVTFIEEPVRRHKVVPVTLGTNNASSTTTTTTASPAPPVSSHNAESPSLLLLSSSSGSRRMERASRAGSLPNSRPSRSTIRAGSSRPPTSSGPDSIHVPATAKTACSPGFAAFSNTLIIASNNKELSLSASSEETGKQTRASLTASVATPQTPLNGSALLSSDTSARPPDDGKEEKEDEHDSEPRLRTPVPTPQKAGAVLPSRARKSRRGSKQNTSTTKTSGIPQGA